MASIVHRSGRARLGRAGRRTARDSRAAARDAAVAARPRFRFADLVDETLAGVFARPARAALTTLGTVLGIASLVATLGISRTAGSQIVGRFDELAATQVTVAARTTGSGSSQRAAALLPWDVESRIDRLNGVVASGAVAEVNNPGTVRTVPLRDPENVTERLVPVYASSVGLLEAVRGEISVGRWFDSGHVERRDRVAVIGADVAAQFGIDRLDAQPGIFIGDELFTVIGILDAAARDEGLVSSIVVPYTSAQDRLEVTRPERVVIETDIGAAQLIAEQAPIALAPNGAEALKVTAPRDPTRTKNAVQDDVNQLFLLLGLISLVVGAIGIANVTLVTVMERTGEIGLRRALGASRRHIAMQFLSESMAMGLVGGIIGATVGIITIVSVAGSRQWTPVLDLWLPLAAPVAGALVGLVAGLYPSIRAARMEPVDALRAGT
ncbi:MAG: ABC transporter permease [Actinobacteria bacterium]|nr:ABC transporter permease [Actinomycetota bacterium]